MRICVDTSAYSNLKRAVPSAVEAIARARSVAVPAIVLGELRAGFGIGTQASKNERELRSFLSDPVVSVQDVDDDAAAAYADVYGDLRRAGTPIPTNDLWIAALAARDGLTVVTFDRHFDLVRRVGVLVLTP